LAFAKSFPNIEVLEFGCFLQEGFRFYNIRRIARNIGVIKELVNKENHTDHNSDKLTDLVLEKLANTNFDTYPYKKRISLQQLDRLSSTRDIEQFFDKVYLDCLLSPDFSVIIRKVQDK
jgi:hypothetical protein